MGGLPFKKVSFAQLQPCFQGSTVVKVSLQKPKYDSSTTGLKVWYEVFVLICCGGALWTNISTLVLSVQSSRVIVLCSDVTLQTWAVLSVGFLLTAFPNKPYFFSPFLHLLSWTLIFKVTVFQCKLHIPVNWVVFLSLQIQEHNLSYTGLWKTSML